VSAQAIGPIVVSVSGPVKVSRAGEGDRFASVVVAPPLGAAGEASRTTLKLLIKRIRTRSLPLQAFVVSRLLVVAAGALGVLRLSSHVSRPTVVNGVHQLGALGYVLSASADRYDSWAYLAIAAHGYGKVTSGSLAYYPGYPLLIRALNVVIGSPLVTGVAISTSAFLVGLLMLHRLTELEIGRRAADATVLLVAFAPLSFFFTAVYTESLFQALSVGGMLSARTGRWRLACALAALASMTRVTGLALLIALGVLRIRQRGRPDLSLFWLGMVPAAFVAYMAALAVQGYPPLGMLSAQGQWHRVLLGPIGGIALGALAATVGLAQILRGAPVYRFQDSQALAPPAENIVLMLVLAVALKALYACRRRLAPEYTVYALLALMMCISSPVLGTPLVSVDRYILTIFPLWMAAGSWVAQRRLEPLAVALGSLLLVFYTAQVATYAFVA
jgi:hypothetical protein